MKMNKWFKEKYEKFKDDPEYITEGILLELNEKIVLKMKELNISRAELAKRLGKSKPFITKLLDGNHNLTVKTMVSMAQALECDLLLDLAPKGFKQSIQRIFYHKSTKPKPDLSGFKNVKPPELEEDLDERNKRPASAA